MPSPDEAKSVRVDEVLPPDSGPHSRPEEPANTRGSILGKRPFPKVVASLLDDFIAIPNSRVRLGLDPIIGFLFPGVGDALTAALGSSILLEALRRGLPRRVLIRMGTNMAINAGVGAIPLFGDVFSVWFKSNARNYVLLQQHSADRTGPVAQPSLWPLFVFLLAIFGLIALVIFTVVMLFRMIFIH